MKQPASQNTTAHTISGRVTCRRNASGWWVYYPAMRSGISVRLRKRFSDEKLALQFASDITQELQEHGISLGSLPREVRTAYGHYQDLLAKLGTEGQTLPAFDVLVTQMLDAVRENLLPGASSVAECVERYLAARKPDLTEKAYQSIRIRLRHFARSFGSHSIQSITPQVIEDWLNGLTRRCNGSEYGQKAHQTKASPDSRNHYRAALITFFSHAYEHGWAPSNPAACVKRSIPDRPRPAVLTPQQAETLLRTAAITDPSVLPSLALQMFAGLRLGETRDIEWYKLLNGDCDVVRVASSKSGFYEVPVCAALREWLGHISSTSTYAWSGSLPQLRRHLRDVFRAAGCDVSITSLRISYYRYRMEITNDAAQTAPALCAHLSCINVPTGAAEAFFKLNPNATGDCPTCPTNPTTTNE